MRTITSFFKVRLLRNFISFNPFTFLFLGKHTPFASDIQPPTPLDNTKDVFSDIHLNSICAKAIIPQTDMSIVIPRIEWVSNTVYFQYRHDSDLSDKNFYVAVNDSGSRDVFKCIFNANGSPSVHPPSLSETSASDDVYETADGYVWKYMYSANSSVFDKFSTVEFMPVLENANVSSNAVNGSIDFVGVTSGGSNYDSITNGAFQTISVGGNNLIYAIDPITSSPNTNFYNGSAIKIVTGVGAGQQRVVNTFTVVGSTKTVTLNQPFTTTPDSTSRYEISPRVILTGDGSNFEARALVNTSNQNSIYKIEIADRGYNYTYATPIIIANTGGVSNSAVLDPIFSPPSGHGFDAAYELGAKHLCISTTFNSQDSTNNGKVIDKNDFRTFGIIGRPLYSNVHVVYQTSNGSFQNGDVLIQPSTNAQGTIVASNSSTIELTNVSGDFFNTSNNFIRTSNNSANATLVRVNNNGSANLFNRAVYFDLTTTFNLSGITGQFLEDEVITGTSNVASSNAVVYFSNSSVLKATSVKGVFGNTITGVTSGAVATISTTTPSDFVRNSGQVLYIENTPPITKYDGQTETIKTIIEF